MGWRAMDGVCAVCLCLPALAQVERVEITQRAPFLDGRAFGEHGAYEELRGTVHFALDPKAPANARVVDLALASRDEDGLVRARANLIVLQPVDPGRFLRHFLWQGFNADVAGRRVFDGMLVLTAGSGRGSFNHRFAQPSRDGHRYSAFFFPTDEFPFSTASQDDPLTGANDGLAAAVAEGHLPKLFLVNTGYEYWGRAAALVHTSIDGERDLPAPDFERRYHVAGAQHFPGAIGRGNPIDLRATYRVMLVNLLQWVREDRPPPPSLVPTLADGSLVPIAELRPPVLPGLVWPTAAQNAYRVERGADFARLGIASIEPPRLGPSFPVLVPQVDGDGNEIGGLRPWELRAPLGTFTPWSLRAGLAGGNGELQDFVGELRPFARDAAAAAAAGDPRLPLSDRHGDRDGYLTRVRAVTAVMVTDRLLLPADAVLAEAQAARLWQLAWGR